MEYLRFIFSTPWTFFGTVLILLILTNTSKVVLAKISREIDKLVEKFGKQPENK